MGAWSAEPFGNDTAADWAWELDGAQDWDVVSEALRDVLTGEADEDAAAIAIAAAEVVARGLGRRTQDDAYTESAAAFTDRVGTPGAEVVALGREALARATAPDSALAELWEGDAEWAAANARIAEALV